MLWDTLFSQESLYFFQAEIEDFIFVCSLDIQYPWLCMNN